MGQCPVSQIPKISREVFSQKGLPKTITEGALKSLVIIGR